MCEILGISSSHKIEINQYLKEFYHHSSKHPHGWGLAVIDETINIEKEPMQATYSHYLKERLRAPIKTKNALAHIRYATIGNIQYTNCHPFTLQDNSHSQWVQIHNGTIFNYQPLNHYIHKQKGDTDSERILYYIMSQINKTEHKCEEEYFTIIDQIICSMSKENKLNIILNHGDYMYVHTNYPHSLYNYHDDDLILVATTPIYYKQWQPVLMNTLLVYRHGKLVYQGTTHQNTFVDKSEHQMLYQIFSQL